MRSTIILIFLVFVILPSISCSADCLLENSDVAKIERLQTVSTNIGNYVNQDCSGMLTTPEEVALTTRMQAINQALKTGGITRKQAEQSISRLITELSRGESGRKSGMIKGLIAGFNQTDINNFANTVLWDELAGAVDTKKRTALEAMGMESVEKVLTDLVSEKKPAFEKMKTKGVTYSVGKGWDFSNYDWRNLSNDRDMIAALSNFFPVEVIAELLNAERIDAIQLGNQIITPIKINGNQSIRVLEVSRYDQMVASRVKQHTDNLKNFLQEKKKETGLVRQIVTANISDDPHKISDQYYNNALKYKEMLYDLGVSPQVKKLIAENTQAALNIDKQYIDKLITQIDQTEKAVIVSAAALPLAIYAAPLVAASAVSAAGLAGTPAAAAILAAGSVKSVLISASIPMMFAAGQSAIEAGIKNSTNGGGFFCHFADSFQDHAPAALLMGPIFAGLTILPEAGAIAAGAKWGVKGAQIGMRATQIGVALGFTGLMLKSGTSEFVEAYKDFQQAESYEKEGNLELASSFYNAGVEKLAAGGVDVAFALHGGLKLATSINIKPLLKAQVAEGKFDYIFGKVKGEKGIEHNLPRAKQNAAQMQQLGVYDNPQGRDLLLQHFNKVVSAKNNIVKTFTNEYGKYEVRESLFAGPTGKFSLFETTWEIMPNGVRRLTTIIPKGGK